MQKRGVNGVMTARNKARAILQKTGEVNEEVCELVCWLERYQQPVS